jgi:hypothetical protein
MRRALSFLFALLAACSTTTETKRDPQVFRAYGDTWVYSKTEISTEYIALDSPHGLFGPRNGYKERHVVTNTAGRQISVPDNLYALQRDGSLKKISCCEYFREQGDLYNFDDRLVFVFDNAREFITDCFIYPARHPDNELKPPRERIYGVTVFAEFDPQSLRFIARSFAAGDNYAPFEYVAAILRSGRRDLTIAQSYAFSYARRKPFLCEGQRPGPPAARVPDIAPYQYGATRIVPFGVTGRATDSFLAELHRFAGRNGFDTWQAGGSPRGPDFSLALMRNDVLIVAANAAELWRVGFYRRMATKDSPLPPEETVEALAREIRERTARLDGVGLM